MHAPAGLFFAESVRFLTSTRLRLALRSSARVRGGGHPMLDLAIRKELAALVYERAEFEPESEEGAIFLADDGAEQFELPGKWYDALWFCPSSIVC
jgi:hypothetical protein